MARTNKIGANNMKPVGHKGPYGGDKKPTIEVGPVKPFKPVGPLPPIMPKKPDTDGGGD